MMRGVPDRVSRRQTGGVPRTKLRFYPIIGWRATVWLYQLLFVEGLSSFYEICALSPEQFFVDAVFHGH